MAALRHFGRKQGSEFYDISWELTTTEVFQFFVDFKDVTNSLSDFDGAKTESIFDCAVPHHDLEFEREGKELWEGFGCHC